MAEVKFIFEGNTIIIQCTKQRIMKDICTRFANKIGKDIINYIFYMEEV